MFCDSCSEEVPDDSIFCPECGARQNLSRASFGTPAESLSGGVATSSGAGVVTPQAFNQSSTSEKSSISEELLSQIASKAIPNEKLIKIELPITNARTQLFG